ncbi:ATP-binding cassette domain-containing protein [Erythromicrobium ramosum]|uniref:ATP-binding cassette domain-containing protein n=3 Tax=Erythrobacter ramosus TaxID=35811 RepID=A0A6I4ULR2_9SPHN|nr:ATP-binding cassette domain-containing protein [Erythrobacter ramosus]
MGTSVNAAPRCVIKSGHQLDFSAFLKLAAPYRRQIAWVAMLFLVGSIAGLGLPWLAATLLGTLFEEQSQSATLVVFLLAAALIVLTALTVIGGRASSDLSFEIQRDVRKDIYDHVQRLPVAYHDHSRQGDLLALMTWEASQLATFLSLTLTAVPSSLVTVAGALAILFYLHPLAAIFLPLLIPGYYLILKIMGRRLRNLAQQVQEEEARVFTAAEQDLEMAHSIKAAAVEELRLSLFDAQLLRSRAVNVREGRILATIGPFIGLLTSLAFVLIIVIVGQDLSRQGLSASELLSVLLYVALLTRPVGLLADLFGRLQGARGTLQRMQEVLKEPVEVGYASNGKIDRCRGAIEFVGVSFAYPGKPEILQNVSFKIEPGETVGVIGKNGAGKSTIAKLLLRFYEPLVGQILIDGVPTRELQIQELRKRIGYVSQQPYLYNASILENITFGAECTDQKRLEEALRQSRACDLQSQLPAGLETIVGDRGVRISGGQCQRIALARALLRNPPIVILDEATSMFDPEGEEDFVRESSMAFANRTVIIISHRPSSLTSADRVFQAVSGRILEVQPIAG